MDTWLHAVEFPILANFEHRAAVGKTLAQDLQDRFAVPVGGGGVRFVHRVGIVAAGELPT